MTNDSEGQPKDEEASTEEPAMDMATLLAEGSEYRAPTRGAIVDGTVMGWDRDGILVDIGAKSEGIVLRHEMQSLGADAETKVKTDDKVLVYIMQPDTAEGQILLSLDRARGEQGWLGLQEKFDSGETFEAEVTGYNKGGLLVNIDGVNAFIPLSQVVGVRPDRNREDGGASTLAESVGRSLRLKVIEINRRRNRVILSERAALQEWRTAQKERLIQELHEGDIRRGTVSSVRSFGVFIDLGGADGLAHLSELSWDRDKAPEELFKVGDEVDVYVTKIDKENMKIALSLRRANPEQWDNVVDKYQEGQVVPGLVTKLVTFGAFARIEGPVEGLIHVSELVDRRIGHPKEVVREGDLIPLKIVRIERDRHRLGLSLRRARDEGEALGYVFTEGGEVLSVPEDIKTEFEAREGPLPVPVEEPEEALPAAPAAESPEASATTATAEPTETPVAPAATEQPQAPIVKPVPQPEPISALAAALETAGATETSVASDKAEAPAAEAATETSDASPDAAAEPEDAPTAEASTEATEAPAEAATEAEETPEVEATAEPDEAPTEEASADEEPAAVEAESEATASGDQEDKAEST